MRTRGRGVHPVRGARRARRVRRGDDRDKEGVGESSRMENRKRESVRMESENGSQRNEGRQRDRESRRRMRGE